MEILINSRKIAETYKKRHANVTDAIRKFIKKNQEMSKHFIESSYITDRGKCHPIFYIDDVGTDILTNKFKYNVRSARFEYKYLNEIQDFLDEMNIEYIPQYQVDNYRIDLYIPKYNTAIEIDEEEHKYKIDYDVKRQKYIEDKIGCTFIRINEGVSCGSVIAEITKELNFLRTGCT